MASQMMIAYLIGGGSFALFVIFWALKSRQFQDQDRAKWLPLKDLTDEELANPPKKRVTASVAMIFVVLAAGASSLVQLFVRLAMLD